MKSMDITNIREMTLGGRIRYFRRQAGISQEALAAEILVTKQSVSQYEHDETDMRVSALETRACVLGVSVGTLVDGERTSEFDDVGTQAEGSIEAEMLKLFRQMSMRDQKVMMEQIKAFLKF